MRSSLASLAIFSFLAAVFSFASQRPHTASAALRSVRRNELNSLRLSAFDETLCHFIDNGLVLCGSSLLRLANDETCILYSRALGLRGSRSGRSSITDLALDDFFETSEILF